MSLPPFEPQQVPEGHYKFKVMAEPEEREKTSANDREFISVLFSFKLTDKSGNTRYHKESFVPWDERYRDLLLAFGAKPDEKGNVHLGDDDNEIPVTGKIFEAQIIHEPDKQDPTKSWSRIAHIKTNDDVSPPETEEDEVPF